MTNPLPEGTEVWRFTPGGGGPAHVIRDRGERVRVRLPSGKETTVARSTLRPMTTPGVRVPAIHRPPEYGHTGHRPQPKPKTARSRAYLDFIRAKPCACCGAPAPSQAAHWGGPGASGGTGLKASDFFTLPACDVCHRFQHQYGPFPVGAHTEHAHHAWVYRIQRDLLAEWVERREGGGE